jgi:hypothetical protein
VSEQRRRRRSDETRESGGLPLIPLVLVVIFAGLLLGALLAHFFGGGPGKQPADTTAIARATPVFATPNSGEASATPVPSVTTSPRTSASPSARPSSTPSPSASPSNSPTLRPSTSPGATPSPHHSPHPVTHASVVAVLPSATPRESVERATPPVVIATATPIAAPAAPSGSERAESVVRSYLSAVASGNRALATTYLAGGVPGEVFMDSGAHVVSLKSASAGTGYRVSADVVTSNGEYALTFSLSPGASGLQITDHYAIKVR